LQLRLPPALSINRAPQRDQHSPLDRYSTHQALANALRNYPVHPAQLNRTFDLKEGTQTLVDESQSVTPGPATIRLGKIEAHRLSSGEELRAKPG
jgi:hypothetical protein